ncbi:MAG: hypothetical protein WCS97_03770, partial [Candidatus Paceibacterota bacterium]
REAEDKRREEQKINLGDGLKIIFIVLLCAAAFYGLISSLYYSPDTPVISVDCVKNPGLCDQLEYEEPQYDPYGTGGPYR